MPSSTFDWRRRPAVSTKMNSRPWKLSGVSIASRVVPATSLTTSRSSPSRRFTIDDLPTFGRPTTATRTDSGAIGMPSGSFSTITSSRSPEFLPFCADTGTRVAGAEIVELVEVRRARIVDLVRHEDPRLARVAQDLDDPVVLRVQPRVASTTSSSMSASAIACATCRRISRSIGMCGSSASPPVSTSQKARPFQCARPKWRSRVVPGSSLTMAASVADDAVEERATCRRWAGR